MARTRASWLHDSASLRSVPILWGVATTMLLATATAGILIGTVGRTDSPWFVQAHLHVGSIGWMTVALVALGLPMLRSSPRSTWTTPGLAFVGAIALFLAGSVAGVVAAFQDAFGSGASRSGPAHAAVLTVPYVVLAASAAVEWALHDDESERAPTTLGMVQVGLAVLSGAVAFAGILGANLALTEANVPLLLASVAIFLARVAPRIFEAAWWDNAGRCWLALSVGFLAIDAGLFAHVLFEVGRRRYSSIELVPEWLLFAIDHVTFVAVMTSALLGAVLCLANEQTPMGRGHRVAVLSMPIGLFGAVAGMGWHLDALTRIAMCVFGGALILATLPAIRLVRRGASTAPRSRRREEDLSPAGEIT